MLTTAEIDKTCKKFVFQIIALTVLSVFVIYTMSYFFEIRNIVRATTVSVTFSFLVGMAEGLVWRMVAKKSPDGLTTFFTAVSGFRMLLAIALIFIFHFIYGREEMLSFCLVFIAFYLVFLIHHSVFFSYVSNSHSKGDKEK